MIDAIKYLANLWCWVDGKFQLGFLSVINRETFHQEGGESRSSTTTEGVEDQETLESCTLVSQFPDTVQDKVHNFFANGVMSTSVVVGSIFLSSDQLLGMEQLSVSASTDFI